MKNIILISALFVFGCTESVQDKNKKQIENEKVNTEQTIEKIEHGEKSIIETKEKIEYSETELFEMFCDSIPNVILPFKTNCVDNNIPKNKELRFRIMNPKYVGDSWAVDGKIVNDNYVLIIHHFDTDGTLVFLRTLDKKGKKIDEIELYSEDCGPCADDTCDVGYVIFDTTMRITQIDSTLWYRTDSDGNQIPGLKPIGREHYRFVYQLSDSGKFSQIK